MKKYLLSLTTLAILLCEASFSGGGMAFAAPASLGNGVTWEISSGTLTIGYSGSGSGVMPTSWASDGAPWYSDRASITKIVVKNGVTSIGQNSFYNCSSATAVEIPPTVTSIGSSAFFNCSALTKAVLKRSSTKGDYTYPYTWAQISFANNTANPLYYAKHFYCMGSGYMGALTEQEKTLLNSTSLGSSITSISNYAFINCIAITEVDIPNTVTTIGEYAFSGCTALTDVTFTETSNLSDIKQYAFDGCSALPSIDLPLSLETIGKCAFRNCSCSSFTSITIPKNVTICGDEAFTGCSNLSSVVWNAVNCSKYNSTDEFKINYGPFYSSSIKAQIQSFTFGEEVEIIPKFICYNFTHNNFKKVVIPASVTEIKEGAFKQCTKLQNIDFSAAEDLVTIGPSAFYQTTALKSIDLRGATSLTSIGTGAFSYTSAMTSTVGYLYIPSTVTSIGNYAFQNRTNLTGIVVLRTEDDPIAACDNANSFNNVPNSIPVYVDSEDLVSTYGDATGWSGFTNITSNKVLEWECGATTPSDLVGQLNVWTGALTFRGSGAMKDYGATTNMAPWRDYESVITILDLTNATTIGAHAFRGMTCLKGAVPLHSGITSIGNYAFYQCSGLTELDLSIPTNLTKIGDDAFNGCEEITSAITLPASISTFGTYAFSNCKKISSLSFGDGWQVTTIPNNAFNNCYKIEGTITIPESVTSIGNSAFYNCSTAVALDLTQATSLSTIGSSSFSGCRGLDGTLIFPSSMTSIGSGAFNNCTGIDGIVILKETTPIITATASTNSFNNMPTTTPVMVATSALKTSYSSADGWNHFVAASFTVGFAVGGTCGTNLNWSLNLSTGALTFSGVGTVMDDYDDSSNKSPWHAYAGCVKSVTLPASLTHIGDYIFLDCGNMTSLTIPNTVTSIGEKAFANCKKIESVTIPADVATIGSSAFYGCTGLTAVTWNAVDCTDFTQSTAPFENIKANIESFSFGEDVEYIPAYLCYRMDNASFTSVTIPESTTGIGANCFWGCSELTGVYYNGTINQWCIITFSDAYANPLRCAENLYIDNVLVTSANIYVSNISAYALEYNKALTSLTLTSTVTIGNSAFESCENLEGEIEFPSSVTTIGNSAFASCKKISAISFAPDASLTTLGYSSFYGCLALRSIVIPQNVNYIGYSSFYNTDATNIRTIKAYPSSSPELGTGFAMFYSVVNANATLYIPLSGYDNYMEKTTWSSISHKVLFGDCGSSGDNVQFELDLSAGTLTISGSGEMADYNNSTNRAPWYDFRSYITSSIKVCDGITYIGKYAFDGCSTASAVWLSTTITECGASAFNGCEGLTEVKYGTTGSLNLSYATDWAQIDFGNYSANPLSFAHTLQVYKPTNTMPAWGTVIGFENRNINQVKKYAFYGCTSLTSATLPSNVETIEESAFYGCTNLATVTLPDALTTIGKEAFKNCSTLTSITIPENVTLMTCHSGSTTYSIFGGCAQLTTIVWNARNCASDYIKVGTGSGFNYGTPFSGIYSQITSITFGENVERIPNYLCYHMDHLTSVTIPASVTNIGTEAFDACSSTMSVTCEGTTPPTLASGAFSSPSTKKLYLPHNLAAKAAYRASSGWNSFTEANTFPKIVQFDLNGQTGDAIDPQFFDNITSKASAPSDPADVNYHTFGGWYENPEGTGSEFAFSTTNITEDKTLYAKWAIYNYQVTFDMQGHGSATDAQTIDHNGLVNQPDAPSADYYTFGGWYKEAGCSNAWDFSEDKVTDDLILYAKWTRADLTLNDNANNSGALTEYDDETTNVNLMRSLISTSYNTICLPFAMTAAQVETYFGANCDIEELTKASFADGDLKLFFTKRTAIEAGKPYLIKPQTDVANPTIADVTIDNTARPIVFEGVTFTGIFSPTVLANSEDLLFLGASNTLYMSSGGTMKGMRGYFQLTTPQAQAAARRSARIVFHEEVATGIETVESQESKVESTKIMRDGQLLIIRDGKTYNAKGALIK